MLHRYLLISLLSVTSSLASSLEDIIKYEAALQTNRLLKEAAKYGICDEGAIDLQIRALQAQISNPQFSITSNLPSLLENIIKEEARAQTNRLLQRTNKWGARDVTEVIDIQIQALQGQKVDLQFRNSHGYGAWDNIRKSPLGSELELIYTCFPKAGNYLIFDLISETGFFYHFHTLLKCDYERGFKGDARNTLHRLVEDHQSSYIKNFDLKKWEPMKLVYQILEELKIQSDEIMKNPALASDLDKLRSYPTSSIDFASKYNEIKTQYNNRQYSHSTIDGSDIRY